MKYLCSTSLPALVFNRFPLEGQGSALIIIFHCLIWNAVNVGSARRSMLCAS